MGSDALHDAFLLVSSQAVSRYLPERDVVTSDSWTAGQPSCGLDRKGMPCELLLLRNDEALSSGFCLDSRLSSGSSQTATIFTPGTSLRWISHDTITGENSRLIVGVVQAVHGQSSPCNLAAFAPRHFPSLITEKISIFGVPASLIRPHTSRSANLSTSLTRGSVSQICTPQ